MTRSNDPWLDQAIANASKVPLRKLVLFAIVGGIVLIVGSALIADDGSRSLSSRAVSLLLEVVHGLGIAMLIAACLAVLVDVRMKSHAVRQGLWLGIVGHLPPPLVSYAERLSATRTYIDQLKLEIEVSAMDGRCCKVQTKLRFEVVNLNDRVQATRVAVPVESMVLKKEDEELRGSVSHILVTGIANERGEHLDDLNFPSAEEIERQFDRRECEGWHQDCFRMERNVHLAAKSRQRVESTVVEYKPISGSQVIRFGRMATGAEVEIRSADDETRDFQLGASSKSEPISTNQGMRWVVAEALPAGSALSPFWRPASES